MDAAQAPSVLAASWIALHTDEAVTATKIAKPPSEDDERVHLLIIFFQLAPYWLSESMQKPKTQSQPPKHCRLLDFESSNITLIATLVCCLVGLSQHANNMVVD